MHPARRIVRTTKRVTYYANGVILDAMPYRLFEKRLERWRPQIEDVLSGSGPVAERVAYYNRMPSYDISVDARTIPRIERQNSVYYYDLKIPAKHFGRKRRVDYVFGDVTTVPPRPALVKSRPITDDNHNSVVFKLEWLRHFYLDVTYDPIPFRDKKPIAVWRGRLTNPKRIELLQRFGAHPLCDFGHISEDSDVEPRKSFMTVDEQLSYRYLVSIEGVDVATNLKWVMNSQSLCFMPRPKIETWYLEGRLQPDVHYVEIRPDFDDLPDKIAYYNDHIDEAEAIVANAQAHYRQFRVLETESLCQLAVLYKYFQLTGQL